MGLVNNSGIVATSPIILTASESDNPGGVGPQLKSPPAQKSKKRLSAEPGCRFTVSFP